MTSPIPDQPTRPTDPRRPGIVKRVSLWLLPRALFAGACEASQQFLSMWPG